MRLTLAIGMLTGFLSLGANATGEADLAPTKTTIAKAGRATLKRWRASREERKVDHGDAGVSLVQSARGQELLFQVAEVLHDVHQVAVPIAGHPEAGPVLSLSPVDDEWSGSSVTPWVETRRQHGSLYEKQVIAAAFREVPGFLVKETRTRAVRLTREYSLTDENGAITVRSGAEGFVRTLSVQRDMTSGTFEAPETVLGSILSFRATHDRLYVQTSMKTQYEFEIREAGGELMFSAVPGGIKDVSSQLEAQSQTIPALVSACETAVTP